MIPWVLSLFLLSFFLPSFLRVWHLGFMCLIVYSWHREFICLTVCSWTISFILNIWTTFGGLPRWCSGFVPWMVCALLRWVHLGGISLFHALYHHTTDYLYLKSILLGWSQIKHAIYTGNVSQLKAFRKVLWFYFKFFFAHFFAFNML